MADDGDVPAPTLQNLVDQSTLKWIFVGGKGGVGKTTTSCSLGVVLSKSREKVLIVSTDPAHNLSDAFRQKFSHKPTAVDGFDNLFCMEIDPNASKSFQHAMQSGADAEGAGGSAGGFGANLTGFVKDISDSLPGIDEAMTFAEIMRQAEADEFTCVVFDTAPTGHTLRLLNFPNVLHRTLGRLEGMQSQLGGLMGSLGGMLGGAADPSAIFGRLGEVKRSVEHVQHQFRNPELTTFVCVCIPEFLSLFETERLVQELCKYEMDTHNIVVNQVLFPDLETRDCSWCRTRQAMQQKYLDQMYDLYEDFHIVELPVLNTEVRGIEALRKFSQFLLTPYVGSSDADAVADAGEE